LVPDLPGYTEMSPSGRGYHAIGYGPHFPTLGSNSTGIEAYAAGRFFTVTGEGAGIGEPCDLSDFVASRLAPMHKGMASNAPTTTPEAAPAQYVDAAVQRDLRSALTALRADDRDTWVRMGHALKTIGEPGRALWLEWSQTSDKWQPADARQWDTFKPLATSYQAVFAEAQRAGWLNPMSNAARMEGADISGILGSIAAASAAPAAASSVWPAESGSIAAYLDTPPPELHWFAHERLLANRAHLLTGVGGTSKTTCLYHLGIGAVTGRVPWGWQIDRTGAALLLLAEDDAGNVHRTISNHVRHSDLSSAEQRLIAERLHVFPMAGRSCRLLSAGSNGTLHETAEARGLFALAKRIPDLRFIALDPALALTEGDEMSPAHQRRLGEFVDRLALETDACVVLASHAAKGVTTLDEVGSHTSRGSGAITDAVRGELVLRTMTASEAKSFGISDLAERKAHVQLVLTKSNAAPPRAFVPIWLRRGEGGLLSLADLGEEIARSPVGVREQRALEVLKKLASVGAPKLKDWREACEQEGLITAPNPAAADKAMQRIKSVLLTSGLIESGMGKGVFVPVYEAE